MVRDMCASALLSEVCLSTVTNAKCADGNADLSVIGLWHTCVWCSMLGVTSVLDLFPYLEIGGSGGLRTPIAQSPSFERSPSQLTGNHLSDTLSTVCTLQGVYRGYPPSTVQSKTAPKVDTSSDRRRKIHFGGVKLKLLHPRRWPVVWRLLSKLSRPPSS